jgi:hypothetical protein
MKGWSTDHILLVQAYEENVCTLTSICASAAARNKAKLFVQVSSASVYPDDHVSGLDITGLLVTHYNALMIAA